MTYLVALLNVIFTFFDNPIRFTNLEFSFLNFSPD